MEILLTEPYAMAGRTVQFPLSSVVDEKRSGALAAEPSAAIRRQS